MATKHWDFLTENDVTLDWATGVVKGMNKREAQEAVDLRIEQRGGKPGSYRTHLRQVD